LWPWNVWNLQARFKAAKPDLIFINKFNYYTSKAAILAAILAKIPFVTFEHGSVKDGADLADPLNQWFAKWSLKKSRMVLVPSESVKKFFTNHLGLSSDHVWVNYHGIDLDLYDHPKHSGQKIRNGLGIEGSDRVICFIGRFTKNKNPETVIDVFQRLLTKYPNLHLIMLGDGELKDVLRSKATDDHIHILDPLPNSAEVLAASDILLLPSAGESFGYVLAEAMAMGVVPVAYSCGAIPEVVGDAGCLVSEGDVDHLISCVTNLLDDEKELSRLSRLGIARAKEQFDIKKSNERLLEVLNKTERSPR